MFPILMAAAGIANIAGEKSNIDSIVVGVVLALAIGFIKVVEAGIVWIINRNKKDDDNKNKEKDDIYFNGYHPIAHLDKEMVNLLKNFHGDATENLRDIASCLRDVSKTQEKLINRMERFEEKSRENHEEILEELSDMRRSN